METRNISRAIRFLEHELGDFMDTLESKTSKTPEDVELVKCMLSGIAKGETIIAMREAGYSERGGYSYADGEPVWVEYRRNDSQNNMNREGGGRNDYRNEGYRREPYRQNSYRRDDGEKAEMIARLRERAKNERDDRRRETIEDMIRDLENAR